MNIKNILTSVVLTAAIPLASMPVNTFADDMAEHTVIVKDYNGNNLAILTVPHGESADLSIYESSDQLNYHSGEYTQVGFNQWSENTDSVTKDMTVYALYVAMTIECSGEPVKTEYFSTKGKTNIDGITVTITKYTQLPERLENGVFATDVEITNITDACTTVPAVIDKAFTKDNTATVSIIPPNANRAILTFQISYFEGLGDTNADKIVDSTDASDVLKYYSMFSTGKDPGLSDKEFSVCDIDRNDIIDSSDASKILEFYAKNATSNTGVTWDELL